MNKEKKMFLFSLLLILALLASFFKGVKQEKTTSALLVTPQVLTLDMIGTLSFASARPILATLEKALENPQIKGVLLNINSPGGTVGSSQEIYRTLIKLKEKGVLIVSAIGDMAASGGYYVASASHYIFSNPGSITGSIGVIIPGMNFSELLKKLGIQSAAIKSGKNKDALSPLKPLEKEEMAYMQTLVMNVYEQFIKDILAGRKDKITEEELRKVADGRVLTGEQALQLKLVDGLGGMLEAKNYMKETLQTPSLHFVSPKKSLLDGVLKEVLKNKSDIFLLEDLQFPLIYSYRGEIK